MRTLFAAAVACMMIVAPSHADNSQASIRKTINIPAQGLDTALQTLSREQDVHVVFMLEDVQQLSTHGVNGEMTVDEALAQLLKGTGLRYERVDSETVTIVPMAGKSSARLDSERRSENLMLARVDTQKPVAAEAENAGSNNADNDKNNSLQEIIVTAQKREERLRQVPISISVLSGNELDRSTAQGLTEALSRVPGVGLSESYQGGGTQVTVRGVTAGSAVFNGSSPIAYYLDSVPFGLVKTAIAPDTNVYDLERVEVLRGPQGTLYGASAQNGVVRILTKDANLNAFEFKARTSGSSTEGGGESYRGDMALNVPIIDGKLAARAVLGYQDLGGWLDRPNKKDANDAQIRNMRLKVNAQPTDQLSIGLSAWLSRADYGGPSASNDNGQKAALLDETIATDFDTYGLKIDYDFLAFSLSSMTSYLDYLNDGYLDLIVVGLADTLSQTKLDSQIFSQEINLRSSHGGPWRWALGGIYRDGSDRLIQNRRQLVAPTDVRDLSKSYAAFGELTRLFLDGRLELTGGARYFNDSVTNREVSRASTTTVVPTPPLVTSKKEFDAVSPRAVLTWHSNKQTTVYASYAEGFRSGFPQNGNVLANYPDFPPLEADTLKNYELGSKSSLWDGRISLEAAIFYIDWQDVQQTLTVNVSTPGNPTFVTALVNGESASGPGFEFAMTTQPLDRLLLGVNFSWNDLKMDADVFSAGVPLFRKGDRLNLSPEYTVGASADYAFPIGQNGYMGRLAASANYTSEREWRTIVGGVGGTPRIQGGDAMTIGRTSFSINAPAHWEVTLFVDNVSNEQGSSARQPFSAAITDWDARVRPRTAGVQLDYRF